MVDSDHVVSEFMEFSELTNGGLYDCCGFAACQVGLFHLTLTQINSEMNFIAKNKCPDSQKLDTRHRGENLNARTCQDLGLFCFDRSVVTCICLHSLSTLSL